MDRIVSAIGSAQEKYGRDAIGVFGGGGLTNEKAYLLGKFARVALRTSQIDYNGRFCMSSAAAAGLKAFGIDRGLPFPLADIPQAQTILLVGSNLAETMPPVMQYFHEQKRRGGALIVVDPRATSPASRLPFICKSLLEPIWRWPTDCSIWRSRKATSTPTSSPNAPPTLTRFAR